LAKEEAGTHQRRPRKGYTGDTPELGENGVAKERRRAPTRSSIGGPMLRRARAVRRTLVTGDGRVKRARSQALPEGNGGESTRDNSRQFPMQRSGGRRDAIVRMSRRPVTTRHAGPHRAQRDGRHQYGPPPPMVSSPDAHGRFASSTHPYRAPQFPKDE